MHLLVFRFSSLGDIAMTVPVFRALFQQNESLRLTLVIPPWASPLFHEFERMEIVPIDTKGAHHNAKGLMDLFRILQEKGPYSAVVDLHVVLRSVFLTLLFQLRANRVVRLKKGRLEKKRLIRTKNKTLRPLVHTVFRYASCFQKLGLSVRMPALLPMKPPLPAQIRDWGPLHQKWIGIAPFAAHIGKMYPLDKMQQVVAYLCQKHTVMLFSAPGHERQQCAIWAKAYPHTFVVGESMSLEEELQILAHLDLMISMDSANAHLSANWEIPTLTVWGQTHPYAGFAPFGQPLENCLLPDYNRFPELPISIFGNKGGVEMRPIFETITAKQIIEKALEIIGQTSS